jgi:hypothetical protein
MQPLGLQLMADCTGFSLKKDYIQGTREKCVLEVRYKRTARELERWNRQQMRKYILSKLKHNFQPLKHCQSSVKLSVSV